MSAEGAAHNIADRAGEAALRTGSRATWANLTEDRLEGLGLHDPVGDDLEEHLLHAPLDELDRIGERLFQVARDLPLHVGRLRRDLRIRLALDVRAPLRNLFFCQTLALGIASELCKPLLLLVADLRGRRAIAIDPTGKARLADAHLRLRCFLVITQILRAVRSIEFAFLRTRSGLHACESIAPGLLRILVIVRAGVDAWSAVCFGELLFNLIRGLLRLGLDARITIERGIHPRFTDSTHALREGCLQFQQLLVALLCRGDIGVVLRIWIFRQLRVVLVDLRIELSLDRGSSGKAASLRAARGGCSGRGRLDGALTKIVEVLLVDLPDARRNLGRTALIDQLASRLADVVLHFAEIERLALQPRLRSRVVRLHDGERGFLTKFLSLLERFRVCSLVRMPTLLFASVRRNKWNIDELVGIFLSHLDLEIPVFLQRLLLIQLVRQLCLLGGEILGVSILLLLSYKRSAVKGSFPNTVFALEFLLLVLHSQRMAPCFGGGGLIGKPRTSFAVI